MLFVNHNITSGNSQAVLPSMGLEAGGAGGWREEELEVEELEV